MGKGRVRILTLVEQRTRYLVIGKLANRALAATNRRLRQLIDRHPGQVRTTTADKLNDRPRKRHSFYPPPAEKFLN